MLFALLMEITYTSELPLHICRTTWYHIPDHSNLQKSKSLYVIRKVNNSVQFWAEYICWRRGAWYLCSGVTWLKSYPGHGHVYLLHGPESFL